MNSYAETALAVAGRTEHCFFNSASCVSLASKWALENFKIPAWREEAFPSGDQNIEEFLGVANAINYCFTNFESGASFDVEYPENSGQIWYGALAMAASLKRAAEEGVAVLDYKFLSKISAKDIKHIFRHKTAPIPMLRERVLSLRNIGTVLHYWGLNFAKIFSETNFVFSGSSGIVEQVVNLFEAYDDAARYKGRLIKFYKRAQLLPMIYHGRALSSNGVLKPIADPYHFGPIADYQVPKVLRALGLLVYNPALAEKIDNGAELFKERQFELEIRIQTGNAMLKLLEEINAVRIGAGLKTITMAELDSHVWNMSHDDKYKSLRHHYTYTTAY